MPTPGNLLACAVLALIVSLAACPGSGETHGNYIPPTTPATNNPLETVKQPSYSPPAAPQFDLSEYSVYFDFDNSEIKAEGLPVISNWAGYLVAHPTVKARLEGNSDERGTREYNIGLGERRANAVKKALEAKGVSALQLSIISYGKERPLALGHDETAWAKNRRADLVQN
jgi:peptidoglycan-associated lipoprotein